MSLNVSSLSNLSMAKPAIKNASLNTSKQVSFGNDYSDFSVFKSDPSKHCPSEDSSSYSDFSVFQDKPSKSSSRKAHTAKSNNDPKITQSDLLNELELHQDDPILRKIIIDQLKNIY